MEPAGTISGIFVTGLVVPEYDPLYYIYGERTGISKIAKEAPDAGVYFEKS